MKILVSGIDKKNDGGLSEKEEEAHLAHKFLEVTSTTSAVTSTKSVVTSGDMSDDAIVNGMKKKNLSSFQYLQQPLFDN